jgi:hypothetical protein
MKDVKAGMEQDASLTVNQFARGKTEACLGPRELKAEDDLEQVIVELMPGSRKSLDRDRVAFRSFPGALS